MEQKCQNIRELVLCWYDIDFRPAVERKLPCIAGNLTKPSLANTDRDAG
jgi:hypothetical protein